jgi:hypothetical protein
MNEEAISRGNLMCSERREGKEATMRMLIIPLKIAPYLTLKPFVTNQFPPNLTALQTSKIQRYISGNREAGNIDFL